jgi:hypothetical protein
MGVFLVYEVKQGIDGAEKDGMRGALGAILPDQCMKSYDWMTSTPTAPVTDP